MMRLHALASIGLAMAALAATPAPVATVGRPGITPVACPQQEWQYDDPSFQALPRARAFFGFHIVDSTSFDDGADGNDAPTNDPGPFGQESFDGERRRPRVPPEEAMRIATSIAGYWAVTPEGSWIVDRMNERWRGPDGDSARWRDPWSAAFISWVMCEGGLGTSAQFQRAVAHHVYVDQALRARGDRAFRKKPLQDLMHPVDAESARGVGQPARLKAAGHAAPHAGEITSDEKKQLESILRSRSSQ